MRRGAAFLLGLLLAACGGGGGGTPPGFDPPPDPPPEPAPEHPPPPPGAPWGTSATHVLLKPLSPVLLGQLLADLGSEVVGVVEGLLWVKAAVPEGSTAAEFLARLLADARVLDAELDLGLEAPEGDGRTIPAGGTLWSVQLSSQADLVRVGVPAAQGRALGQGVKVAVLDSGLIAEHPFLQERVVAGGRDFVDDDADPEDAPNGIDDDEDGFVDEGHGHGTFAASLVVAVAPEARVLVLRVLGSDLFGTSSAVASAIMYAVNQGVHVIHMSLALPPEVEVVREAIQNAQALGIAVVASAGNTGVEDVSAAQGAAGAFLVTALDAEDRKADFASYGEGVALSAPGVDLHGAFPNPEPDTAIWSGTSFSAPLVTGGFALLRELYPLLSSADLLERLRATAASVDTQNPGLAGKLGAGRLDLDAATAP